MPHCFLQGAEFPSVFSEHSSYEEIKDCYNCAFVKVLQGGCVNVNLKANVAKLLLVNLSLALVSAVPARWCAAYATTYLFLLLVKIVDDDTNEEVQCEERPKDDENHKVQVHVQITFPFRLLLTLQKEKGKHKNDTRSVQIKILMQFKESCPSAAKIMKEEKQCNCH